MADEILPQVIPSVLPGITGPAVSIAAIRRVTDSAGNLLTNLANKIKKSIAESMADAGKIGAALEVKVAKRLSDLLSEPEALLDGLQDLAQNHIAGLMAPAAAALQDFASDSTPLQSPSALTEVAGSQGPGALVGGSPAFFPSSGVTTTRAMRSTPSVRPPPRSMSGRGLVAPPAAVITSVQKCEIPDRATIVSINQKAQDIADATAPDGQPLGAGYYSFDDTCCWKTTAGDPHDLVQQYPADWKQCMSAYNGIDYGPGCRYVIFVLNGSKNQQEAGFRYIDNVMRPAGAECGVGPPPPPPPPVIRPPTTIEGTCPPPCIEVTCPPIPPCPSLELPSCVMIDLCDWDRLCDTLKNCLRQVTSEDCALDNETAYVFRDCDGTFGEARQDYWSDTADSLNHAADIKSAVKPSSLENGQLVNLFRVGRDLLSDLKPV